jgi:hypothetical protein
MKCFNSLTKSPLVLFLVIGGLALGLAWPLMGTAQGQSDKAKDSGGHAQHNGKQPVSDQDLAAQVRQLQAKITKLEAALKQGQQGAPPSAARRGGMPMGGMGMSGNINLGVTETAGMMGKAGGGGMAGMKPGEMMGQMMQKMGQMQQMMGQMQQMMGEMQGSGMSSMPGGGVQQKSGMAMMGTGGMEGMNPAGMKQMMQKMGGMPGKGAGMPGMMDKEMMARKSMEMMGGMKGMGGMSMPSALPGFPGASHIYHIGATDFFLDHADQIKLTTREEADLNRIKEKALLDQATSQRRIDEAEQELWTLTASDRPDATKIEAKVRQIEKLRGEQRVAFIRAIGEAAKVLTDEQRQALLGHAKPQEEHLPAPSSK